MPSYAASALSPAGPTRSEANAHSFNNNDSTASPLDALEHSTSVSVASTETTESTAIAPLAPTLESTASHETKGPPKANDGLDAVSLKQRNAWKKRKLKVFVAGEAQPAFVMKGGKLVNLMHSKQTLLKVAQMVCQRYGTALMIESDGC